MLIVESSRRDVFFNLALEEFLLDHRAQLGNILLLYVNDAALVIGRNQNPWRECDVGRARREKVPLARRFSGGGTVYHDAGNLNYSFIVPRAGYDQSAIYAHVLAALQSVGVNAVRQGKSNLVVDGRKISGTAFCFRKDTVVHHGTLLVSTDLDRLQQLLQPSLPDITTRAIASIPAVVTDLATRSHGLTIKRVKESLISEAAIGAKRVSEDVFDAATIQCIAERNQSWELVYGHTPAFETVIRAGAARLGLKVAHGLIERATLDDAQEIKPLKGLRFEAYPLARCLREMTPDSVDFAQLAQVIEAANF